MNGYSVKKITYGDTKPFILGIHYAKRMPSISYAFGLFKSDELVGVCTFGMPASPWLCKGVCGEENKSLVLELNRLVLKNNIKNEASFFIAECLKQLPRPRIIVSYADTAWGHLGTVYKASNFLFTGTTKPRTDMAAEDGKHSRHHKGDQKNRVNRSAKHRFVIFVGSKNEKQKLRQSLKYPVIHKNEIA
tara:strand:+ start:11599 stop:12168 length:570 start_codon:yes stop_codon:yes gene_type:complete